MVARIADLRVQQAQRHGRIVGLSKCFAEEVAALADFLVHCRLWSDVTLPFDGQVEKHGQTRWRVPVGAGWWIVFGWIASFGPVELEMWHEDDG
jgi:hypothetical protein